MDGGTGLDSRQVEAVMTYLVDTGQKPFVYEYGPPPGQPLRSHGYADHRMVVRNARLLAGELSLDRLGFTLTRHETRMRDFYDEAAVTRDYYPEVERLVRDLTGASRVVVFDHNVRNGPSARRRMAGVDEPVRRAHVDYTVKSAPRRVRDLLPADDAEFLLRHRFAVMNVWRPIRGPVEDAPLALCDARSVAPKDLVATDLRYPDRTGETYSVAYNPDHRWYYFPKMQPDEAILLKNYDSAEDGRARFAPHSAFDDPTVPAGAAARESIEARALVFFAPAPTL